MRHEFEFHGTTYQVDCANLTAQDKTTGPRIALDAPEVDTQPAADDCHIRTLELLVSQQCNLACTYCYANGGEYNAPGRMAYDTARKAVDSLFRNSGPHEELSVTFFGGEPLIEYETIKKTIRYAQQQASYRGKRVSFSITTNGLMLDSEKIAFFRDNSVDVMVSVDGDRETHDRQRPLKNGGGSSNLIFPKIAELLDAMPDSPARATIVNGARTPSEVKKSLHELGFRRTGLSVASGTLFGDVDVGAVSSQDMAELLEDEAISLLNRIKHRDAEGVASFDSSISSYVTDFLNGERSHYPCGAGRQMLAVSAEGDLFPCHRFVGVTKYKVGNLDDDSAVSLPVFDGSPIESSSQCSGCFAKYLCGGACYHDNVTSTGSLLKPNPNFCATVRRSFEMAAFVVANLTPEDRQFFEHCDGEGGAQCKLDLF